MGTTSFDFGGSRVVVLDGARGLGLTVARAFAEQGASVVVTGPRSRSTAVDDDLSGLDHRRLDLTDAASIHDFAADFTTLDVVVDTAELRISPAAREDSAGLRRAVAAGALGPLAVIDQLRSALSATEARRGGVVVHTGSLRGWFGFAAGTDEDHGALIAHTARQSVAWRADGVRVCTVLQDDSADPADVAATTQFLASDAGAGLSGQLLRVQARPRPAVPPAILAPRRTTPSGATLAVVS